MAQLSSHILDTSLGRPAAGVLITLTQQREDDWFMLASEVTDDDGRVKDFAAAGERLPTGIYKLTFYLSEYHQKHKIQSLYPHIEVVFELTEPAQHYHIPLLLSPFGYSTYRGS